LHAQPGVIDDDAVEHPVDLVVDPVGTLDFAVEPGRDRLDVDATDATVEPMPVERALKLGPVVRLDDLEDF
jgi:hypothetical protein